MKNEVLIRKLAKMFPESRPVCTSEWNGTTGGIWFRGSESCLANGERVFDHFNMKWDFSINPKISKVLKKAGWFAEPHDAGTCMAWPSS